MPAPWSWPWRYREGTPMEYYETLRQQMLDYYCSLAGNTPDQA